MNVKELNDEKEIEDTRRVFTEKKDFPLSTIKEMFDEGDIIPQPDYQRDYVMDQKQASRLIESVLMGIPIPTIYLCEESDGTYDIIDGQQRMTSFVKYLKNEFALKGLEELLELNGKRFRDLDKAYQRNLKTSTLNSIILTKESQELKYEIFARLNRGSVKLKPQELRNCIYRGSFNDMIECVAKGNKMLEILFSEPNNRKNYQEYILRFYALRNFQEFSSSLSKTMNKFMQEHQNINEQEVEDYKKLFTSTIDIVKQVFGNDVFMAYDRQSNEFMNKFSGSVYDSVMVACSMFNAHDLMAHADDIRKQVLDIKMNNALYKDYSYGSTGSKNKVVGRIMIIYNAIAAIVGKASDGNVRRIFTKEEKEALWHDGCVCSYCNQEILSIEDAEVDHVLAFGNGGDTLLSNAQLLHRHCNREKNDNDDFDCQDDNEE